MYDLHACHVRGSVLPILPIAFEVSEQAQSLFWSMKLETFICQSCAAILKGNSKTCAACGASVSVHSPTCLPVISQSRGPHLVAVNPDPAMLEQAISARQLTDLIKQERDLGTLAPAPKAIAVEPALSEPPAGSCDFFGLTIKTGQTTPGCASAPTLVAPAVVGPSAPKLVAPTAAGPDTPSLVPPAAPGTSAPSSVSLMADYLKDRQAQIDQREKARKKSPLQQIEDDPEKIDGGATLPTRITSFGIGRAGQNRIVIAAILLFVIFGFLKMGQSLFDQSNPKVPAIALPAPTSVLPNLTGDWKIRYTHTPNPRTFLTAVAARQQGSRLVGKGSDEMGDFTMSGRLTAPANIELLKVYSHRQDPKSPIVMSGTFTLPSDPIHASGIWIYKRTVGRLSQAHQVVDTGFWQMDVFPNNTEVFPFDIPALSDLLAWFAALPLTQKFAWAAGACVFIIVAGLSASLAIFGPVGKMNRMEKQKYIPSQFKPQHDRLVRELSKSLKPGSLPLGRRCEWKPWSFWRRKNLSITPQLRVTDPHVLIVGTSDKGKSRLMAKMIAHDIEGGDRAVVVIDSDGGLSELMTRWISAHHRSQELANRVVFLNPTSKGNTLGYNPLEMPDDEDLQSAASALVHGFKAIYTEEPGAQSQWNHQTANILRNAALLLMVNGKTLADLPALLNDNDFRDVLLESVEKRKREKAEYLTLIDTWGQYKRLARSEQWINWVEPILNRVTPMLSDARMRAILTKPVSDIKLRKLIEEKGVLIVKVAKGQLDHNANLLGSLLVTGVKQAALSLANEASSKQNPLALYLDEFDHFIEKETMQSITSDTDNLKIGFIGCIKTLQHLPEDFRHQLIIAVGTIACFALAKKDADLLGPQMFRVDGTKIKHQTIQNFFNKVNTSPQFEPISDEEKLNIDRLVGQEARTFFCYKVGTVAGVFHLKAHDFKDIAGSQVKKKVMDKMRGGADKEKPAELLRRP